MYHNDMRDLESFQSSTIALIGAGGFGKEIVSYLKSEQVTRDGTLLPRNLDHIFVESNPIRSSIGEIPLISIDKFRNLPGNNFYSITIANPQVREKISQDLGLSNCASVTIKSNQSIVSDDVLIGEGAILTHFTLISSNVKIGKHFHLNIYSYVAHDCVIGNYVTFSPGVKCNGHVHIEDNVFIGSGAIIKPGTADKPRVIGKGAVIGMGAVVTKDVHPYSTVIGNPAREI